MAKETKTTKKVVKKKNTRKNVGTGLALIRASFNNTIVTLTDATGAVLVQSSPGALGYKGSKRSTAYVATLAAREAAQNAVKNFGLKEVKVYIKGPGAGRNAAVKGLDAGGLQITTIVDRTPLPHNGCRPRKLPRR